MKLNLNISNPKVLYVLVVFFIIFGGVALNPFINLVMSLIAGMTSMIAILKSRGWIKVLGLVLLALSLILVISAVPRSKKYMDMYKKHIEGSLHLKLIQG